MADDTQKPDFSHVFAMGARTGDLKRRSHCCGCCSPTNRLTDRHSGHVTYFGSELRVWRPQIPGKGPISCFVADVVFGPEVHVIHTDLVTWQQQNRANGERKGINYDRRAGRFTSSERPVG
jgi:hypothetical protein